MDNKRKVDSDGFAVPAVPPPKKPRVVLKIETPTMAMDTAKAIYIEKSSNGSIWCNDCTSQIAIKRWSNLIVHCSTIHGQKVMYECITCGFEAPRCADYLQHRRAEHPQIVPPFHFLINCNAKAMAECLIKNFGRPTKMATSAGGLMKADQIDHPSDATAATDPPVDQNDPRSTSNNKKLPFKKRVRSDLEMVFSDDSPTASSTMAADGAGVDDTTNAINTPDATMDDDVSSPPPAQQPVPIPPMKFRRCALCSEMISIVSVDQNSTRTYDPITLHALKHLRMPAFTCSYCGAGCERWAEIGKHIHDLHANDMSEKEMDDYVDEVAITSKVKRKIKECFKSSGEKDDASSAAAKMVSEENDDSPIEIVFEMMSNLKTPSMIAKCEDPIDFPRIEDGDAKPRSEPMEPMETTKSDQSTQKSDFGTLPVTPKATAEKPTKPVEPDQIVNESTPIGTKVGTVPIVTSKTTDEKSAPKSNRMEGTRKVGQPPMTYDELTDGGKSISTPKKRRPTGPCAIAEPPTKKFAAPPPPVNGHGTNRTQSIIHQFDPMYTEFLGGYEDAINEHVRDDDAECWGCNQNVVASPVEIVKHVMAHTHLPIFECTGYGCKQKFAFEDAARDHWIIYHPTPGASSRGYRNRMREYKANIVAMVETCFVTRGGTIRMKNSLQ